MTPEPAYKARLRELFTSRTVAETENALIKQQVILIAELQREVLDLRTRLTRTEHEGI